MNRRFTLVVVAQGGRLHFWRFNSERAARECGEWLKTDNRFAIAYYVVDDCPT